MSLQAQLYDVIEDGDDIKVRQLLKQGAPMIVGFFAIAARKGFLKILNTFIEYGWDINTPQDPFTPSPVIETFSNRECLEWFLNHGVNINKRCSSRDKTPLSCAVQSAPMPIIQLLFEHGGDVECGQLLHFAALRHGQEKDDSEVLRYIYSKDPNSGKKINKILDEDDEENFAIFNKSGLGAPLHFAVRVGSIDSVKFLLKKGADPTVTDPFGYLPLDMATRRGREDIIKLLLEYSNQDRSRPSL